jgi:archaellum component FlaC
MEDEKLIALLDERFAEVRGEFAGVKTCLDSLETEVRKLRVDAHENNVKIERNNELIELVDEKLGRFRAETKRNFKR